MFFSDMTRLRADGSRGRLRADGSRGRLRADGPVVCGWPVVVYGWPPVVVHGLPCSAANCLFAGRNNNLFDFCRPPGN